MRSRQTSAVDLTGEEIASSNTTLNTLLGGRQKSWMVSAGVSVRPTPRVPMRQSSSVSVLPSPAPSSEPSPVFPFPQEILPFESNPVDNQYLQSNGPSQFNAQPTSSIRIVENLQRPNMQTSHGPSSSIAPVSEAQQTSSFRTQRSEPTFSSIPSLQSRLKLLDDYIRVNGGVEALTAAVERPRFGLLRDACTDEDYFFVALHQLFCLWTIDPPTVMKIEGFRDGVFTTGAFLLITKLIRSNDQIRRPHLQWLAEFPSPLHDLLARSDHYRRAIATVAISLGKFTSNKAPLFMACMKRGYPPLVDEMVNRIGFITPLLQSVFFTASRRTLGIPDDETGHQMEKISRQDREGHRLLAARFNTSFPPSEKEIVNRNRWVVDRFLAVRNGRKDPGLQNSVPVLTSPNGIPNRTAATASVRHAIQSPVEQPYHPGTSISYQPPIPTATLGPITESPVVEQFPFDRSGGFQGVGHQPIQTSQANNSITGQVFSNNQSIIADQISPTPLENQFPAHLQYPSQYLQPAPGNFHQHTMPAVGSNPIPAQQNNPARGPILAQQRVHQQMVQQRNGSTVLNEQIPQITYRGPTVSTQGSVPGTRPVVAPSPAIVTNPNSQRPNQNRGGDPPLLIPLYGQSLVAHAPNPEINAAHHSYLRSPYLVPRDMPSGSAGDGFGKRYYQAVKDFAFGPVLLSHHLTLSTFEFHVPDTNFAKAAKDKLINAGAPASREVRRGTLQYRMRCILAKQDETQVPADCAVADTAWPASIFMEFNGASVDVRRKLLHGKDLPVDITQSILNNTKNLVKVSVPRPRKSRKDFDYIFVVEVVEVLQHQQILDMCLQKQCIPAQLTIDNIKQSLSGSLVDDDDISMEAGDLTINLADPYMAQIFDIPVRGSSCLHRECFDLKTFLLTRNSKPKLPCQISMVDVWKCPLCSKDARPYSLNVDGFLVSVRERLAQQNMLHTKAIIVAADGSWEPKPEELPTKRSSSQARLDESEEENEYKSNTPAPSKSKEMEIIVLDDD